MPIYEYRCPHCGRVFEARRAFADAEVPAACPDDGAAGERLLSSPVLRLPGRGSETPDISLGEPGFKGSTHHSHDGGHGHTHGPGGHTH